MWKEDCGKLQENAFWRKRMNVNNMKSECTCPYRVHEGDALTEHAEQRRWTEVANEFIEERGLEFSEEWKTRYG